MEQGAYDIDDRRYTCRQAAGLFIIHELKPTDYYLLFS